MSKKVLDAVKGNLSQEREREIKGGFLLLSYENRAAMNIVDILHWCRVIWSVPVPTKEWGREKH